MSTVLANYFIHVHDVLLIAYISFIQRERHYFDRKDIYSVIF
jgi:hypothetical protein